MRRHASDFARAALLLLATACLAPAQTPAPVDSLTPADLQQAIPLLKANYINPDALSDQEINRATMQGLLERLGRGVMLLPEHPAENSGNAAPFRGEILDGHVGYLRLGSFTKQNLGELDANLQAFAGKKVNAGVIDLRASGQSNDFALAAEFANRFCEKGKPLFTLRKPGAKQERIFTSSQDPAYRGMVIVLADSDTAGAPEAMAGVLRFYDKAMVIGQPTAGRAVDYADSQLPSGKILRVAVAEAVLPDNRTLFPEGVKPDLPVPMPAEEKRQIFEQSGQKGMGPFVFETDRPRLNEAALQAGTNPEIEAMQNAQQRRTRGPEKPALRDPVLQRALDLVTSVAIFEKRAATP